MQIWANQKLTQLVQLQTNMGVDAGTLGTDLGANLGADLETQPEAGVSNSLLNRLKRLFQPAD